MLSRPGVLGLWFVLLDPDEARSIVSMARDFWHGMKLLTQKIGEIQGDMGHFLTPVNSRRCGKTTSRSLSETIGFQLFHI
jgi:hypothetical protein